MRFAPLLLLVACTDPDPVPETGLDFEVRQDSADGLDFGEITCGSKSFRRFVVVNKRDRELTVTIDSSLTSVKPSTSELVVPAGAIVRVEVEGAPDARDRQSGEVVLSAENTLLHVPTTISGMPRDQQVTFDPHVEFGQVLTNMTYERTIAPISNDPFSVPITLGTPSTPRFEIVGATSALISAADRPTFTVRLIAGSAGNEYTGTIPVTLQTGTCGPREITLHAVVVP